MGGGTKKEEFKVKRKEAKKAMKEAKKEKLRQLFGETAPPNPTVESPIIEDSSEEKNKKNKKRKAEDNVDKQGRTKKKAKTATDGASTVTEEVAAVDKTTRMEENTSGAPAGTNKADTELTLDFMAFPKEATSSKQNKSAKKGAGTPREAEQDGDKKDKEARRQAKRELRAARKSEEAGKASEAATNGTSENSDKPIENNNANGSTTKKVGPDKRTRYILFVGNIPHTATKEDLEKYFAKVKPLGIRLMTDRSTGKSRGFAFIDFEDDKMARLCLKSYHHSHMQDGSSQGRRINVELTAGGGGNSKDRKTKIHTKNDGLNAQRQRRYDHDEKKKIRAERKDQKRIDTAGQTPNVDGAANTPSQPTSTSTDMGIHPERLAQMRKRF